nr:putative reverse transcriptase domain-containing protein [Tanacetum cinerariifolium]
PITNNQTEGKKLPDPMLQPQLRIGVMLEIYPSSTIKTYITMINALQSVRGAKEPDIERRIIGSDFQSFVSYAFTPYIDIAPATLNTSCEVELANGMVVSTNTILCGCTLVLINRVFKIDLLPTQLGNFDIIVGMDWLAYHRVVIDCYEKIVRIPLPNGDILEVQGERPEKDLRLLSCIKANKKKPEHICIVCDFPKVFPDDLSGLPHVREIEFHIDLIPGALLVVKSPYRLAPSKMIELSNQLKELQEKGFIRPSHSPWGALVLFVKKKDCALRMCIDYR